MRNCLCIPLLFETKLKIQNHRSIKIHREAHQGQARFTQGPFK